MKIAVAGLDKNRIESAIKAVDPSIEVVPTNDIQGAQMVKTGTADYYFGACYSGGGAAISMPIGLVGYARCCTVCKSGSRPNPDEIKAFVDQGKVVFGMTVDSIDVAVPMLVAALTAK